MRLRIIKSKYYSKLKRSRNIAGIILFICLILIGRSRPVGTQNNGILKALSLETLLPVAGVMMVLSGLYLVFSWFYSSMSSDKGWITLTDNSILLQYKEGERLFNLSDIKEIVISQHNFTFQRSKYGNYSGNNWLEIETNNEKIKEEFELYYYEEAQFVKDKIEVWKHAGLEPVLKEI